MNKINPFFSEILQTHKKYEKYCMKPIYAILHALASTWYLITLPNKYLHDPNLTFLKKEYE